jgi:glycyl-tRNA synthetase
LPPTGTKDPFGLRRAAIGVVQPLIEHNTDFDLRAALKAAAALEPVPVTEEVLAQVQEFITGRLRVVLLDMGYRYDVVDAILAVQANNPAGTSRAIRQLSAWVERKDWNTILPGYARCVRIIRSVPATDRGPWTVAQSRFEDDAEKLLFTDFQNTVHRPPSSVNEFLEMVVKLLPSINTFFDKVLVMAEDKAVRENRLGLVQRIASLADGVADLSKLEGF